MNKLMTEWGANLDPKHVLPEYPRPQMVRESYINLNGYWDYTITHDNMLPVYVDGQILVPFAPESQLSGVEHVLLPEEYIWYKRSFTKPAMKKGERLLLNFGAVDQLALVYLNRKKVGSHVGGYTPFTFDITDALTDGDNILQVCVRDLTDTTYYARGKQKLKPGGMFYTPVSGIWQTVWMEIVPEHYVSSLRITPDTDAGVVEFLVGMDGEQPGCVAADTHISVFDQGVEVSEYKYKKGQKIRMPIVEVHLWTPEDPFLYEYEIEAGKDTVRGYFAMRKFSVGKDENGIPRLLLNNRPYFHNGLLDQGYWPDGIYTAPSDEALAYDIITMKQLGFNMLRKHAKIEPLRWYYHCDRLGMIVWQDIVNGGGELDSWYVTYRPTGLPGKQSSTSDHANRHLSRNSEKSREQYRTELKETVDMLYNIPSLGVWTLFNEGWGQFDALDAVREMRRLDPTRLLDHASGWFDQGGGDMKSLHIYFTSFDIGTDKRPIVISEFGGYSLPTPGHVACDKVYGYKKYKDRGKFMEGYEKLYREKIIPQVATGLCAAVYTQVSDIEEEINGLLTYDRSELKVDPEVVHKINKELC